jgi:hypothetical protein
LINSRDDRQGKVKGAGKLPLSASLIRHRSDDVLSQLLEVFVRHVVFVSDIPLFSDELVVLGLLKLTLQGVKDSGSDQQVRESANNQRQRSYVLLLHCQHGGWVVECEACVLSALKGNL